VKGRGSGYLGRFWPSSFDSSPPMSFEISSLRTLGATVAVADATWANLNVVVAGAHGRDADRNGRQRRSER
jgi:hypothetical protein